MTWSKFDDLFDEHEKIEDAWFAHPPNPVGLFVMATTACNRWLSDGVIRPRWLERKLPKAADRDRVLATMVDVALLDVISAGAVHHAQDSDGVGVVLGPFTEDRYVVHDFLDRHDSKRQVEERRARDSARKLAVRRKDSRRSPSGVRADSPGSPDDPSRALPRPDPTRPDQRPPLPPEGVTWDSSRMCWAGRQRTVTAYKGDLATYCRGLVDADVGDQTAVKAMSQALRDGHDTREGVEAFLRKHWSQLFRPSLGVVA